MSTYLRLLEYVAPYWRRVVLLLLTVTLFASLSGLSLTLVHPFVRIIISPSGDNAAETPAAPGLNGIPLPDTVERLRQGALGQFESWMYAGSERARLLRFCTALILLFFIKNIFGYAQTYQTEYLEQKILYRIRNSVYRHLQNLPMSWFDREKTGHVISRLTNDVTMLRGAAVGVAASVLRNGLMTLIGLVVVFAISWKLSMLTLVVIPFNLALIGLISTRLRRRSSRTQAGMADMTAAIEENVSGMRVVKAFNMGDHEAGRFDRFNGRYMRQFLRMKLWGAVSSPTSELLGTAAIVIILWYGGNLVIRGAISPENLVLFVGAIIWVVTPVKSLAKLNNTIQESIAAAERVFDVLDSPVEPSDGTREARFERELRFDGVTFQYVPDKPVLKGISFAVQPGEVTAIVGSSGAGKTTLVDLIPRFYEVVGGRITLDGVDTRELQLHSLRDMMGIVTQEIILFNDTVRSNITYGSGDKTDEEIHSAAIAANSHDFIQRMPEGYDTVIGDRGVQLSGGQRQRLAIARAILKDPKILIFDEATSALDTESEILVQGAIDRLLKNRTTFVIAHRLSTIKSADRILVLDGGLVSEKGTHRQLMDSDGTYRKLYDLQFGIAS